MEYKDNVLGNNVFQKLQQTIKNDKLPWFFNNATSYTDADTPDDFSFSHLVVQNGEVYSSLAPFLEACVLNALDSIGEPIQDLLRIRLGLITCAATSTTHSPHVDYEHPHKSGLIYLNDADGDTVFYDQFYDNTSDMHSQDYSKEQSFTVHKAVTPKANRIAWFDGLRFHASSTTTTVDRRLVLNFNYV